MRNTSPTPAADLLAANERLLALRRSVGRETNAAAGVPETAPKAPGTAVPVPGEQRAALSGPDASTAASMRPDSAAPDGSLPTVVETLPPHLGWESTAVTSHLRQWSIAKGQWSMANGQLPIVNEGEAATAGTMPEGKEPHATLPIHHSSFPVHRFPLSPPHAAIPNPAASSGQVPKSEILLLPDLALAFLREEQAAEGRLWLLLRHLDEAGQGWISKQTAVAHLTDPASPLCLYHERYLRLLLARGDGVFWQWTSGENGRIWLYRPERVAAALGRG